MSPKASFISCSNLGVIFKQNERNLIILHIKINLQSYKCFVLIYLAFLKKKLSVFPTYIARKQLIKKKCK